MKIFNTHLTDDDRHRVAVINQDIAGWSGYVQYGFFKAAFAAHDIRHLLMLGVYMGRDLAYILDILKRYHPTKDVALTGVDKFNADPCGDWTEEQRKHGWRANGFGEPPSKAQAHENLLPWFRKSAANYILVEGDDEKYLEEHPGGFDLVYLDTDHSAPTVRRQIAQCTRPGFMNPGGILCGDDYIERPEWGVIEAVNAAFPNRLVLDGCIWVADL